MPTGRASADKRDPAPERGSQGGLNRSSQHSADVGCDDDRQTKIRTVDAAQITLTGGVQEWRGNRAAPFVVPDCLGSLQRGRCHPDRHFAAGRNTVVSRGWRHAPFPSGPIRAVRHRGATCAWKSAKRSLCSWRKTLACVRLPVAWAARSLPSRGRSAGTPLRAPAVLTIGRPRPGGMLSGRPSDRRPRSWRRTRLCGSMCRSDCRAISRTQAARSSSGRRHPGTVGDTDGGNRVGGPRPGAPSRSPAGCG